MSNNYVFNCINGLFFLYRTKPNLYQLRKLWSQLNSWQKMSSNLMIMWHEKTAFGDRCAVHIPFLTPKTIAIDFLEHFVRWALLCFTKRFSKPDSWHKWLLKLQLKYDYTHTLLCINMYVHIHFSCCSLVDM